MAQRQKPPTTRTSKRPGAANLVYSTAAVLALLGLAAAVYLTMLDLTGQSAIGRGSAGCSQVLSSK